MELAERVVKAKPDDMAHQERLAMCHTNLAIALKASTNASMATAHYQRATEIRKRIDPSVLPGVTLRLAASLMNEGVNLWGQNPTEAEKRFHEAEQVVLSIPPDRRDERGNSVITLGQINLNWGGMLHNLGRFDEAIARSAAGLKEVEPYFRIEPNDSVAREVCLKLHGNRGLALGAKEKHREAADDWKRVVELSKDPVPPAYRVRWAIELVGDNDVAGALSQAQLVKTAPDISGEDCYNLACIFARCAALARKDSSPSAAKQSPLVESHLSAAWRWLKCAKNAGFFREPAIREHAGQDPDLEILRESNEFRKVIDQPAAQR